MWYSVGNLVVMTGSKGRGHLWYGDWVIFEVQDDGSLLPVENGQDDKGFESPMEASDVGGALGIDAARRAQGNLSLEWHHYNVKVKG